MELTRLLNDPHAVLRETGIKIPEGTTPNTIVVGPSATPTIVIVGRRDIEGNIVSSGAVAIGTASDPGGEIIIAPVVFQ